MKKFIILSIIAIIALSTISAAPTPPLQPNVTFELLSGLPATMNAGETYTVEVLVTSDTPFLMVMAMPDMYFPGRFVVAHGVSRSGAGTEAVVSIPFTAKGSTADLPGGTAPVSVVVGARFRGGMTVGEQFDFNVAVP